MALKQQELDPEVKLFSQFEDTLSKPTILLNVFHVPLDKQEAFKKAWQKDALFFESQPGAISAQLHQGIHGSHMFVNYAVFENTAAFAATTKQPEFWPNREIYTDGTISSPHLFRRLHIPLVCVGESE